MRETERISEAEFAALWPVDHMAPSEPPQSECNDGWPKLPPEALIGLAGDVVRVISPQTEADPVAILVQFLVAAGNAIGPGPHCRVGATTHGLNLFAVKVGESSKARKGTSWSETERIFRPVDPTWTADRVTGGLSSAEGLVCEVQDDSDPPKDRRLLIVQAEFASVLKVITREGNTLSAVLRAVWDTGNIRVMTKREPQKSSGAHISMIGDITKPELLRYLSDTEQHNGFSNRILWLAVRRSKFLPEGGHVPASQLEDLSDRLLSVTTWARTCSTIKRDETATKLWAEVYPRLSAGLPGLLGAATSRAEAQVLRLSALYAVLDMSATIGANHLLAALAVWEYCLASARLIFGDATGDPVADRIRAALEDAENGLTRTEISSLFKRHESTERITQALAQLEALRVAERRIVKGEGRATEIWFAKNAK